MAKAKTDKRNKSDLQLLVLALVDLGLSTPYLLQAKGGLSQGATLPALSKLARAGHVHRGAAGDRGRREYQITGTGRSFLRSRWGILIEDPPPTDIDAVVRIATLSLLAGESRKEVGKYLAEAAVGITKAGENKRREERLPSELADVHAWMRSTLSKSRIAGDSKILKKLSTEVKKLKLKDV